MTSKKNRISYSFLMTCNIFVILKVYPEDGKGFLAILELM